MRSIVRIYCTFLLVWLGTFPSWAQDLAFSDGNTSDNYTKKRSLKSVIEELEDNYGAFIICNSELIDRKVFYNSKYKTQSIEDELNRLAKFSNLSYKKVGNNFYVITEKEDVKKIGKNGKVRSYKDEDAERALPKMQIENTANLEKGAIAVNGVVISEGGVPLPGLNVLLKGTTTGTVTDVEGNFNLTVPEEDAMLVFSFVGYERQEVRVNGRSPIDIVMAEAPQALNEVVVTALGIERGKKALAYSVSEVEGGRFTKARETNIANALTGNIAGVNATGLAMGPGGSSRVIIRGNGSLSGNNQPLYVVNGMPIDNSIPGGGSTTDGQGINVDRGDGIAGINPDDIETISVLKGGAAAALYGSRAANGVILITTKRGKAREGIGVEYNTNLTFDTPSMFPDYQYQYGAGANGRKPLTQDEAIEWGRLSFGAPMDGEPTVQFDGVKRPYSPVYAKDNIKNFYRTGTNFVNTLAFTGGGEAMNFRLSLSNMDVKSIVPNSSYNRKTANLNLNAYLGERLSIETVAQYNLTEANNRPGTGYADFNAGWATQMVSNTVDIRNMAPGYYEDGSELLWNPVNVANNPYWVVNRYQNHDKKNRFIGQANIRYDILDNLFVRGGVSQDLYSFEYVGITPSYTAFSPKGSYESFKSDVSETNAMLTLNYTTNFFERLSFSAMVGGNKQRNVNNSTVIEGQQFTIPEFYSYTNLATLTITPDNRVTGVNSLFGSMDFGYKGLVFLTLTGRQDWFSTLSPESNSIFYPSVGGSFILSEAVQLPKVVSFVKLRASWAQVGGGAPDPYLINQNYSMVPGGHNGRPVQEISSRLVTNPDLRPLTSTTYEGGIDVQLLDSRVGIDLTFYNRKTTGDIVRTDISNASGYTKTLLNVGELSNKGIELLLKGTPIRRNGFVWNLSYNAAYNKSEILTLAEGLNTIQIGTGIGGGLIQNVVGRPYGTIWGYKMATNENGETIYDPRSGYALKSKVMELGQGVPPLTMGLNSDFRYKSVSLSILLDGKFGNSIYSNLAQYSHRFGLTKATLPGRENGLHLAGVDLEGNPYERTVPVEELDTYYDNHKNYTALFVYDGSFIKLRQVVVTYNLPVDKLNFVNLHSASISLVGRNLASLYKNTDLFDPESSYTSGNAQGLEAFGVPRTRSYGINVNVKF